MVVTARYWSMRGCHACRLWDAVHPGLRAVSNFGAASALELAAARSSPPSEVIELGARARRPGAAWHLLMHGRGWAQALQRRETGERLPSAAVPVANTGVLILEEQAAGLPGGILSHVQGPIHYLDLGGIQHDSLADFGGRPELLAGVVKLYASGSGLRSLAGLQHLSAVRYLYLDRNQLPASELLRLTEVLPAGLRLETLDVSGNPGCSLEVERQLLASSLMQAARFFNGRCVEPHR